MNSNEQISSSVLVPTTEYIDSGGVYRINNFTLSNAGVYLNGMDQVTLDPVFVEYEVIDPETKELTDCLKFRFKGTWTEKMIPVEELIPMTPKKLIASGINIIPSKSQLFYNYLTLQRRDIPVKQFGRVLGWQKAPNGTLKYQTTSDEGTIVKHPYYDLYSKGTFELWMKGFCENIVGRNDLELMFCLSLVTIFVGLDSYLLNIDLTPFVLHMYGDSSSGKSTTAIFLLSTFTGVNTKDSNGLFRSHLATYNALVKQLGGLVGVPLVLDEVSMADQKQLTKLLYTTGNGVGKTRLDSGSQMISPETFSTVIISDGEEPYIDQSEQKGGALIRLIQLSELNLTESASHAETMKKAFTDNGGHFASKFAGGLLKKAESGNLLEEMEQTKEAFLADVGLINAKVERVAKRYWVALYAAKVANELGCGLNVNQLKEKLIGLLEKDALRLDYTKTAFQLYLNYVEKHQNQFQINGQTTKSSGEVLGTIETTSDGVFRISVSDLNFSQIISELGFPNMKTILKSWKKSNLTITESDRLFKRDSRKQNLVIVEDRLNLVSFPLPRNPANFFRVEKNSEKNS